MTKPCEFFELQDRDSKAYKMVNTGPSMKLSNYKLSITFKHFKFIFRGFVREYGRTNCCVSGLFDVL